MFIFLLPPPSPGITSAILKIPICLYFYKIAGTGDCAGNSNMFIFLQCFNRYGIDAFAYLKFQYVYISTKLSSSIENSRYSLKFQYVYISTNYKNGIYEEKATLKFQYVYISTYA